MAGLPQNRNLFFIFSVALVSSTWHAASEAIIGFDGIEHDYPQDRQADISRPRLHSVHRHSGHVKHAAPHMLNQGHRRSQTVGPKDGQKAAKAPKAAQAPAKAVAPKVVSEEEAKLQKSMEVLRAQLCVRRAQDSAAWRSSTRSKCMKFMVNACETDRELDGSAMKSACRSFFESRLEAEDESKVESESQESDEDANDDANVVSGLAPAAAPAAAPASSPFASPAAAPGPSLAGAPGPAPAPAEEEWKYGMGMEEALKRPEQGFEGDLVEHDNGDTMVSDWQKEFGPKSGHQSLQEICAQHPDNDWCRMHGHFTTTAPKKSASVRQSTGMASLLLAVALAAANFA